jgi:Fic family protein
MYRPRFRISPDLLRLVSEASELRASVASSVVDVSWLPVLQRETAVRLTHSSTSIEGNPLTLPEVEALARGDEIAAEPKARREVLNYLAAMRWIWRSVSKMIDERSLLALHELLTRGLLPKESAGHYKQSPNRVVDGRGTTVYTPPPPDEVSGLCRDLMEWIQSNEGRRLHPVVVCAIAHHRLVSIHPFSDGNGRTARALGVWLLYARGFDTHHLFALDEYFQEDRKRYYEKIQQARELDDDLSLWIEYVAEGVVEVLRRTRRRIESLKISVRSPKIALTRRQEDLLRFLTGHGRVKSPEIEKALRLTRARVNQIVKPLVDAGLIIREGRTRATTYRIAG